MHFRHIKPNTIYAKGKCGTCEKHSNDSKKNFLGIVWSNIYFNMSKYFSFLKPPYPTVHIVAVAQ